MDVRVNNCFVESLNRRNEIIEENEVPCFQQYVKEVLDFSSQYGSDVSISYTAYNLVGKPANFPEYGDFPQAFVMKTYGTWWMEAPSSPIDYMPQNNQSILGQDYVDVAFEIAVFPKEIAIFETYNPGAVVRIWALEETTVSKRWAMLWEGPPRVLMKKPRKFIPPIQHVNFKTRILRIEFNHSLLDYYTGIDAVMLGGVAQMPAPLTLEKPMSPGKITQQVIELNLHNIPYQANDLKSILTKMLSDIKVKTCPSSQEPSSSVTLDCLPPETILKILSYLDLRSLHQVAQVSHFLNGLATDALLFSRLSLRPYWHSLSDNQLVSLTSRCSRLTQLDLSWCGNYGLITPNVFHKFLKDTCSGLTHLRLNCCKFVNNTTMKLVADTCPDLRELALRNCGKPSEAGFLHLTALTRLTTLDLYRTYITINCLIPILWANQNLQHLNIGSCTRIREMNEIFVTLGKQNRKLVSLDIWKTANIGHASLQSLSACSLLEELDFGWCVSDVPEIGDLHLLAKGCPRLRKLFLTALRGITDRSLEPFITHCPNLEQIDLLGIHGISADFCMKLLLNLPKLRFLDLSFCDQISDATVACWRKLFPHVSIKRSTQQRL